MTEERSEKRFETRPGWACCFRPKNPKSQHPADFVGITVLEGKKHWVHVYKRLDKNGNVFVSVRVQPADQPPASQAEPRPRPMKKNVRHNEYIP
jgi:hypothetical protein